MRAPSGLREFVKLRPEVEAVCRELGIRLHRAWDDQRLVRRMAARNHWTTPDGQRRAL